jgi:hypothetical protein
MPLPFKVASKSTEKLMSWKEAVSYVKTRWVVVGDCKLKMK